MMAYAVFVDGKIKIDTVYEVAALSKFHWLAFNSGDYDQDDFSLLNDRRLDIETEFDRYPEAEVRKVSVAEIMH